MFKHTLLLTLLPATIRAEELLSPVKTIEKQGIAILKPFDTLGGTKGYLGKYQDMGVTIYVAPDDKHAISDYVYNEKGENPSNALMEKGICASVGRGMWQRTEKAPWILDGRKEAPVIVYVFVDPLYPYCKQFWQRTHPWIDFGRIQLHTLLAGVIKLEDSIAAAVILTSKDPTKIWHGYEALGGKMRLGIPMSVHPEQMKVLNVNQELMDDLGASMTSAVCYMNKSGTLQQEMGLPGKDRLNIIVGNK